MDKIQPFNNKDLLQQQVLIIEWLDISTGYFNQQTAALHIICFVIKIILLILPFTFCTSVRERGKKLASGEKVLVKLFE